MNPYEQMIETLIVIKEDAELKNCFVRLLSQPGNQQVKVATLRAELEKMNTPKEIVNFVSLLGNDKVAYQVLLELTK